MVTGQIIHRSLIIYKIIKPENTITTAFAIFFITFCVLIIWIILFVMASITTTMCFDRSAGDGNNTLVDPNDPRCRDFRYKLMNIYDFNIATFVAIPFEIYNYDEQKLQLSLYAVMLFGFLCFLLIASICTVIVCSTLIIRKIKSSSFHLSQKNMHAEMLRTLLGQNMHAEMLRTLLGQALSPILLLQLPLLISVIAIGVEGDLWWLFFTMYFTLAWFPTIQPMILILGVASYRKRFFKILESIRGSFKCQLAIIRPKIREETISSASTMRF
ncbi:unnamed protein product, partial [Mesorhabditis belari]|uniref:G protein-coupled receptor n=1 Tax=Mesorhabditis belari TaxID=2138241 RepID=A0AAF3END0_9BILA